MNDTLPNTVSKYTTAPRFILGRAGRRHVCPSQLEKDTKILSNHTSKDEFRNYNPVQEELHQLLPVLPVSFRKRVTLPQLS
jgi:hypothetical protein